MEKQTGKFLKSCFIIVFCFSTIFGCKSPEEKFQSDPILKIGLVADPQYENKEPAGSRYYKETLWKLKEAVDSFNTNHVDFVQTLGDIINGNWESFDSILPVYDKLDRSIVNYHLLGNHEFAIDKQYMNQLPDKLHMPASYYSYKKNGWRFIILDGTDYSAVSLPLHPEHEMQLNEYRKSAIHSNNYDWNGAIGPEQQIWLISQLDSAKLINEKVIIFCHMPVKSNVEQSANLLNDYEIIAIIEKYPCVIAYIDGHNHRGDLVTENKIHYFTLKGMVEGSQNSFAILNIFKDQIQLKGFGNQQDISFEIDR